ncbi:hypothetical protein [Embleya sp. NPDC001921]
MKHREETTFQRPVGRTIRFPLTAVAVGPGLGVTPIPTVLDEVTTTASELRRG